MKDHTTAEIFEELWKRIEYDANVSEELASESNELQKRIDKAIRILNSAKNHYDNDKTNWAIERTLRVLKGSDSNDIMD